MGGKVVQARQGDRDNYQPLQSTITSKQSPIEVISDLFALQEFSTVYIADIDAITEGKLNSSLYSDISACFPTAQFLLDAGIKHKSDWDCIADYSNIKPVIGSETLLDLSWLDDTRVKQSSILSLDFKLGQFLGDSTLLTEQSYWPSGIIVMNLDRVGAQSGPDIKLLAEIKLHALNNEVFAAGGVRGLDDLSELNNQNIDGVLIATALHDGRVSKEVISIFEESKK